MIIFNQSKMQEEISYLKGFVRPEIEALIGESRQFDREGSGPEYSAIKALQADVEHRIFELEHAFRRSAVDCLKSKWCVR